MIRFLSSIFFILGNAMAQFRDPITLRPTIGPLITPNTIAPIRTIAPIIPSRSTTIISTFDTTNLTTDFSSTLSTSTIFSNDINNSNNEENEGINMELIYILVPTLGSIFLLLLFYSLRKKRNINNVVNIDLNIENRIADTNQSESNNQVENNQVNRLPSNSGSILNHIYEEVDYEARYEMPSINNANYENIAKENEYGKQVTTIV